MAWQAMQFLAVANARSAHAGKLVLDATSKARVQRCLFILAGSINAEDGISVMCLNFAHFLLRVCVDMSGRRYVVFWRGR